MNRILGRTAVVTGVALVGLVGLSSLLGPSAGAAASTAAVRGVAPARTACINRSVSKPWSFAVEADTQWTVADDGKNPNTAAIDIARQLDRQFIGKGVKFVVEVGDLCDNGSVAGEDTRAVFAQELYNAGIGFYPLSGNHDDGQGHELTTIYPQTQTAMMNQTPASAFLVTNPDTLTQPFPMQSGKPFQVGTISASPAAPSGLAGLDYAVDYRNARLVFLDQFSTTGAPSHEALNQADVDWMNGQLTGRKAGTQAFVFGHKGIITQNHVDTLFGNDPTAQPALQNTFIRDLQKSGVRYYVGGHDHMYNRAFVASPDGKSSVQDIVSQSDASKFYIPFGSAGYAKRTVDPLTKAVSTSGTLTAADPTQTNDYLYSKLVAGGSTRETPVAQDLNKVGYFIFHVNGPKVTVDYYAAVVNPTTDGSEYLLATTPAMTFVKAETFGYSLNGKQFSVPQGQSYTSVKDSFQGTTAKILGGTNGSSAIDAAGRTLTRDVDTGWTSARGRRFEGNILTLWGLADVGAGHTDTFALSMSVNARNGRDRRGGGRDLSILVTKSHGRWIDAVAANDGGTRRFVAGPYKAAYGLGTYGVDRATHTAWAVVDHAGQFAVAR